MRDERPHATNCSTALAEVELAYVRPPTSHVETSLPLPCQRRDGKYFLGTLSAIDPATVTTSYLP
jgi:hypothetical protein